MTKRLDEWLSELENRHSQEIQLGLSRVRSVAETLNLLHPEARVITVAGTNGKGSTVAILESIYHSAGFAVASYTSPHLLTFNERIKINRQAIDDEALVTAFEVVENARGNIGLTYFEATTLAALWHFQQHTLDVIILEVGLGGRLDATNIIDCDLAIITTIDIDHEAWLGNTIEAIAFEKAGILRAGRPYIYADEPVPESIVKQASALGITPYCKGIAWSFEITDSNTMRFYHENRILELPNSRYHANSVAAAVMATLCLQTLLPVSDPARIEGILDTELPGRMQLAGSNSHRTLLDVAHNPQAAACLARHLSTFYSGVNVHAVFSAFADKDLIGLVSPLKNLVKAWYPVIMPGKRAASATQLTAAFAASEINISLCYNDPVFAWQAACSQASANDLIVVYGSFIIVGMMLPVL